MKTLYILMASAFMILGGLSTVDAHPENVTETFKKHFNITVQQVHRADSPEEKRMILNESFSKMIEAVELIESRADLSGDQRAMLSSFKNDLTDKQSELNGLDGFEQVEDVDLDEFSNFSQDYMEQANRTVTLSVTTALLIVIILLLL